MIDAQALGAGLAGARQRNFSHGAVASDLRSCGVANLTLARPHASLRPKSTGAADIGAAPRHILSTNDIGPGEPVVVPVAQRQRRL